MNFDANIFYSQITEIYENEFFSNREKLFLFFDIVKNVFNIISENEKSTFTEFAKFNFVFHKFQIPFELKNKTVNFRKLLNRIKKNKNFIPNNKLVIHYLQAVCELISFLSKTEISNDLLKYFNSEEDFNDTVIFQKTEINRNIRCIFISKIVNEDSIKLICVNEEGEKISIKTNQKTFAMFNMIWKNCLLNFSKLEILNPPKTNQNEKNESNESVIFYKTTRRTQVTVEPDFLIDVTEITDCFTSKEIYPIIPIVNKFLNKNTGFAAFKGNIINNFFDELLENIEIDFETSLKNALEKKPLLILTVIKYFQAKTFDIENFNDLLKIFRAELYDIFDHLRSIIIENYLGKNTVVEPSFISNIFGLQGRLDLMIENSFNDSFDDFLNNSFDSKNLNSEENTVENLNQKNAKSIDIIELKSGRVPPKEQKIYLGFNEKRMLFLPLWINHYIQIICYNMLLKSSFDENSNHKIGFSSILYSTPKEQNPIRNVVDNFFVQNEILTARNWIVAFLRELTFGNLSIIESISNKQLNYFPVFSQDFIKKFIDDFTNLSEIEKQYLRTQIAFITKEMFANKIGMFANSRQFRSNSFGFSSLWLQTSDEKKLKGTVISNLFLNENESDFEKMHIRFDLQNSNSNDENESEKNQNKNYFFTTFRKGDICILYPSDDFFDKNLNAEENIFDENNEVIKNKKHEVKFQKEISQVIKKQLLRGRILEIDDEKITVSFRNKISNKLLNSDFIWSLEADYMEVSNNYLFSSVSEFSLKKFENKDYILGLKEPTFVENNSLTEAVEKNQNLTSEKKSILKTALSAQNYFLIQGPPGSGKTSFLLKYLTQILFQNTNENILILAYTNRAVDEICYQLNKINSLTVEQKFDFIRLGNRDSSEHSEKLLSNFSLENIKENFEKCRCFVSTVTTANATPELFQLKNFDTIIVDEAAQILESHIIGLLSKTTRFIMIGDEKQLPAVTSISEKELLVDNELLNNIGLENLGDSLFERLLRISKLNNWKNFAMLEEQSRMNFEIMQLANNLFYEGKLKESSFVKNDFPLENFASKYFSDCENCIFINSEIENNSKINLSEIEIILDFILEIKNIFGEKFNSKTLGIISPWRMQCNEILNRLNSEDKKLITVDTVERFQGSEREIIIFSTATNNIYQLDLLSETKEIGGCFVDRKLNVAITRAKQKFILLGNKKLLSQKEIYRKLLEEIG